MFSRIVARDLSRGIARDLSRYVALAFAVFSFCICAVVSAQTCTITVWFQAGQGPFSSANAACASLNGVDRGGGNILNGMTASGPSDSQGDITCAGQSVANANGNPANNGPVQEGLASPVQQAASGAVCSAGPSTPQNPSGQCTAGASSMLSVGDNRLDAGAGACAADGCGYTANSLHTSLMVGSGGCSATNCTLFTMQKATGTGIACTAPSGAPTVGPPMPAVTASSTCGLQGGGVTCAVVSASGTPSAVFSGDLVTPSTLPATGCVAFASGGVACVVPAGAVAAPTPPAPNSGVSGVTAAPDGVVTAGTPNGVVTGNYFKPTTVGTSTSGVLANGSGTATGATGTPKGTGTGTGGAATGTGDMDCAFSNNCAVPAFPAAPANNTIAASGASYMAAVEATPIVEAFANIGASIPGGSCPAPQFTIWSHTFTMDQACTIFNTSGVAAALSAICLIVYTVMGARILMSA
jgi:hypothetical protein